MEGTDATKEGARVEEGTRKKLVISNTEISQITGCGTGVMYFLNVVKRIAEHTDTKIGLQIIISADPSKLSLFTVITWGTNIDGTERFKTLISGELFEDVLIRTIIALEVEAHKYGTQETSTRKTD